MEKLILQLQERYKPFNSIYYEYSNQQYQLKVVDDRGIKYFINSAVYGEWDYFEFDAQFTKDGRAININTVSRTSDPEEKFRPYPTIEEIENMFENMRVAYWSEYYELFT